jgi:phosphodiesterase/alkaline phosphatase D-like protein
VFRRRGVSAGTDDAVDPSFILSGGAAPDGVLVHSTLAPADAGKQVDLAVWRADGSGQPELVGLEAADEDSIVRHVVNGKAADTAYLAQLVFSGARVGEKVRFKTLPPAADASWTRRIAVVSCQNNAKFPLTTGLAFDDIQSWRPDDIWHLGDWGYWGQEIPAGASYKKDLVHYSKSMGVQSSMRKAFQGAVMNVVTISDHELTINGDPTGGIHNSPETIRELVAFQKLFPVRKYGDTRTPRRGRYYSYDIGTAVRVIVTDFRSPDRSNVTDDDGPDKTMFGDIQLAWLFDTLDANKVNLVCNETSWLADFNDQPGGKRSDKPWTYPTEQLKIRDYIMGHNLKVAWIGGDRHYVGYLRGTDDGSGVFNSRGEFPCYISSGTSKNQLPLQPGELMTWQFGSGPDLEKQVCGYMRLTLTYDAPSRKVTLHGQGRAVLDTSKPKNKWVIHDIPGGVAVDSWTLS